MIRTFFIILLFIPLISCGAYCLERDISDPERTVLEKHDSRQKVDPLLISDERVAMLPVDKIVGAMDIKTGMKIADIGAGTGFFSFPLADALKGTGMVFATEIHKPNLDYLAKEITQKGYRNITPVLVHDMYNDPFYTQHTFDILFVCDVLPYVWRPKDLFSWLKASLAPGTGRLYVLELRTCSDFTGIDFGDFSKFGSALKEVGEDSPVFKKLSPVIGDFFRQHGKDALPPPDIQKLILRDLNAMLLDKGLFDELVDYYYKKPTGSPVSSTMPVDSLLRHFDLQSARLIRYLVDNLTATNAFDKDIKALSPEERERFKRLNKLILGLLFRVNSFSFRQEYFTPTTLFKNKKTITALIEAAGYELTADHDFLPKYYFLEFKRK